MKVFILVASMLLLSVNAYSYDPTRFLAEPNALEIVTENGSPKVFSGGHDEKYFAKDAYQNIYKLRLKNALPCFAEVESSILAEAIGIPNAPVFPIMLKRGGMGLPDSQKAKVLAPHFPHAGVAGKFGNWFSGTVQPVSDLKTYDVEKLTPTQKAELFGNLILNYLIDNRDLQLGNGQSGNIVFNGKHFFSSDITQAFRYSAESKTSLESFLRLFRFEVGKDELPAFLHEVNAYITRIEKLDSSQLKTLFEPYFAGMSSFRKFKKLPEFDFHGLIMDKISSLRNDTVKYLDQNVGLSDDMFKHIVSALDLPAPHINIPANNKLVFNQVPGLNELTPAEHLWSIYFEDFHKLKEHALSELAQEMNVDPQSVPIELSRLASKDTKNFFYVSSQFEPFHESGRHLVPQLSLNAKNSRTLVVVPVNDLEAAHIAEVAKQSNAEVMELRAPHGAKLDKYVDDILEEARAKGVERIILSELPEAQEGVEDKLAREFNLLIADHHKYDNVNRTHRLSSLEQVAEMLGYRLNSMEKIVGVNDGAFVGGLSDLGVSKVGLKQFLQNAQGIDIEKSVRNLPEPTLKLSTSNGPLYIFHDVEGSIGKFAGTLGFVDYPAIPNVVLVDHNSIRFSGKADFVEKLTDLMEGASAKAHYHGGDVHRSMFWGLKGVDESNMEATLVKALSAFDISESQTLSLGLYQKPRPVSELLTLLATERDGRVRVKILNEVNRQAPSARELDELINLAKATNNSFEIGKYMELAYVTKDARWKPVLRNWLADWEQADLSQRQNQWKKVFINDAKEVIASLRLELGFCEKNLAQFINR